MLGVVAVGKIDEMHEYFANEGAVCPKDVNPAEFMIDVVSGHFSEDKDWGDIWENSENNQRVTEELDRIKAEFASRPVEFREEDHHEFASTTPTQLRLVLKRATIQVGFYYPGIGIFTDLLHSFGETPSTSRASSSCTFSRLSSTDS